MKHVLIRTTAAVALLLGVAIAAGGAANATTTRANRSPLSAAGMRLVRPHATGVVAHVYTVNSTADSTLYVSAPVHECQDTIDHSKCSLRAAIEAANNDFEANNYSWDVIKVPAGTYVLSSSVDSSSMYFDYSGNLQIDGAGPTQTVINASSFDNEILEMEADYASLSVSGVGFTGGYSEYGGAVYVSNNSGATFTDCAFTSNESVEDGGAIDVGSDSTLSVSDSTFTGNETEFDGGAIYDSNYGVVTLSGDTFSHNSTSYENTGYGGGAVYTYTSLSVDHSTFKNNTSGNGGAVYAGQSAVISTSTFSGNQVDYYGGAVYAENGLNFDNNTVSSGSAEDGGGVFVDYIATLSGDAFSSDSADYGGDVYDDDQVTILNSTLTNATATEEGGSVYNYGDALTMTGVTISGSRALETEGGGGGVYSLEGSDSLTNVTITKSSAPDEGYGGAVLCDDCTVSVSGGSYTHNSSVYGGGAFYIDDALINMNGTTVSDNTSEIGAGVYTYDGSINADNSTFSGNNATEYWGGAVSTYFGGYATITNSSLTDNRADGSDGYGGAIALYSDTDTNYGTLTNDTIAGNQAWYAGGIYTFEAGLEISNSTVADNTLRAGSTADYGGGLYNNESYIESTDTIWSGNAGDQCAGSEITASGGFNLDSDNTCGLYAVGDIVSHAATLGPLQNNGGSTETIAPLSGSLAIGTGGTSCPSWDQRGVAVPAGQACDIGSVFVASSVVTQATTHPSIVFGAEQSETIKITVTSKASGAKPAGAVEVFAGTKLACVASISNGKGQCTLGPKTLKKGTYKFTSKYLGAGDHASAASSNKTVKVT